MSAVVTELAFGGLLVAILAALLAQRFGRRLWHGLANVFAERNGVALKKPFVIDGDTLVDLADGERYRLANIDAPELSASCAHERQRAELAKYAALALVRSAQRLTVRRTWRRDIYGRRIAFACADGADIGAALVAKGFALPWRGRREKWCGTKGGLAKISENRAMPISCKTCGARSRF